MYVIITEFPIGHHKTDRIIMVTTQVSPSKSLVNILEYTFYLIQCPVSIVATSE